MERVLRGMGLAALALWLAIAAWPRSSRTAFVDGDALEGALSRLTTDASADSVHVQLDTTPDARNAHWLAALRGAGIGVSWSGAAGGALALESYRSPDPSGPIVVLAATPGSQSILSDGLGPIDTISVAREPTMVRLASAAGDLTLRSGTQPARIGSAPGAPPRRVFVVGAAGWEPKFVIAALEESAWAVDARLFVSPDQDVVQGGAARVRLDTSRYAAVVLMDSAAAEATPGVVEFVRTGGGVVLAGDANRARRVAALVGWRARARESAPLGTLPGDTAWRGLSRFVLDSIAERRAITLESRDGKAIVAARRHYAGRVVAIGYDQTWRWRMAGGDNSAAEHRVWWSRAIAGVAARAVIPSPSPVIPSPSPVIPSRSPVIPSPSPVIPSPSPVIPSEARDLQVFGVNSARDLQVFGANSARDLHLPTGSAPLAALHDVLGPPAAQRRALAAGFPAALLSNIFGALCLSALLAEWLLRRGRGAK